MSILYEQYKEINGIFYYKDTPDEVITVLETCRKNKTRIVLNFGDAKTGVSWGETYGTSGRVGNTTGPLKRPILVHNKRSHGGLIISDDCILSIKTSLGKKVLYKHSLLVE